MSSFNEWVVVDPGSGPSPPQPVPPGIPDAPSDGSFYGRENAAWTNLPVASTSVLGGVKVDGTTVAISGGVISAVGGGPSVSAPVSVTAPTITGTGGVGQTLSCSTGSWTNSPSRYDYQWQRDGSSISGATSSSYTLVSADSTHSITCTVTATNASGFGLAVSNAISVATAPAPVNTVAPVVTGTAAVGSTLSCSQGTWINSPTTYTYQWLQNGSNITGATTSSYVVASTDAGHSLLCSVSAKNTYGTGSATSNSVTISGAPVNTVLPVVTGTNQVGQILTCSQGTWTNSPSSYTYQWLRNGVNISGAASPTYTLVTADGGQSVACAVAANNGAGSGAATSASVTIAGAPTATAAAQVTGTGLVGQTLTCSQGVWTNSPTSFAYQWLRGGANITGATSPTYALVTADGGNSITCIVTATNSAGFGTSTSNAINVAVVPVNTVAPFVAGLSTVGHTLTSTSGTWTGFPTRYDYQWLRSGTNISGATLSTYVLATADVGFPVSCKVTASNAGGSSSSISNAITASPPFLLPAGAAAVYSLRNIVSGYSGQCLNIRRWSDGVSIDVGFTSAGDLDMSTALAWAAGAIMTVNTWYDQSGNHVDLTQVNASQEPQLLNIGGQPYLAFGDQFLYAGSTGPLALTGDQTIGVVLQLNSDIGQIALECDDDTNGWAIFMNGFNTGAYPSLGTTPGKSNYYTASGGLVTGSSGNLFTSMPARAVFTRTSGAVTVYNNGVSVGTGSGSNTASSAPFTIGCDIHASNSFFEGLIGEVFIYSSALTSGQLATIDAGQSSYWGATGFTTPSNGVASVQFGRGESIAMGNVLNFERTQPYTIFGAIQLYSAANRTGSNAYCLFTNVPGAGPAYPGYELWMDNNGKIRVRIMHDIGASNYIGLIGSVNIADGFKHIIAATYDGSSTAAGVKLYVDGVLDTSPTIEHDALTASIIGAGQSLFVGTQQGVPTFNLRGMLGRFQVDNVVRAASYIHTYNTPSNLPPVDANTVLCLELTEGSGTTAHDSSASWLNGTLSHATMWIA